MSRSWSTALHCSLPAHLQLPLPHLYLLRCVILSLFALSPVDLCLLLLFLFLALRLFFFPEC